MLGYGSRSIKDKMTREILEAFESENIEFAFPTYEVAGNTSVKPVGETDKQSNVNQWVLQCLIKNCCAKI